jgi:hypothetical protein
MFLIFFGTYKFLTKVKSETQGCPKCGGTVRNGTGWFWVHIFFIPIFPYKKVENFAQCKHCNSKFSIHQHTRTPERSFTGQKPLSLPTKPYQYEEEEKSEEREERREKIIVFFRRCNECGEKLTENATFCMKCGFSLR